MGDVIDLPGGKAPDRQDHQPRAAGRLTRAKKRARVLELRAAAMSEQAIADHMTSEGYPLTASGVSHIIRSEIDKLKKQASRDAETARELDIKRLDDMLRALWPRVLRGELPAHDRALKIMAQRQRLMGLTETDDDKGGDTFIFNFDPQALKDAERTFIDGTATDLPAPPPAALPAGPVLDG